MNFTAQQPKAGDLVLTCAHVQLGSGYNHFYQVDLEFQRPDLSKGHADWIIICNQCFTEHATDPESVVCDDSLWVGDEPIIEDNRS